MDVMVARRSGGWQKPRKRADSKIIYYARPKSPGRSVLPAAGAAPTRFVLVNLGHRDLRRTVARPLARVLVAGAVGVVALILVIDGFGLAGRPLVEVHRCLLSRRLPCRAARTR